MPDEPLGSPDASYQAALSDGQLTYQRCANGHAFFPPRPACPQCHDRAVSWAESAGGATIYSATTISPRDRDPYTVVILDVDEGFRMMSRIDGPDATTAAIGDRVRLEVRNTDSGSLPMVAEVSA